METKDNNEIYQAAKKLVEERCSVVPIKLGKKAPSIKWEIYQRRLPTERELSKWFSRADNQLGLVTGNVSQGRFIVDFDGLNWEESFQEFLNKFPEFRDRGRNVVTGSGKLHIHGRCPDFPVDFNRKIKHYYDDENQSIGEVELRGNKHQSLVPPSIHPCGNKYNYVDEIDSVPEISRERFKEILDWMDENQKENTPFPNNGDERLEADELTPEQKTKLADYYLRRIQQQVGIRRLNRNDKGYELARDFNSLKLPIEEAKCLMLKYASEAPDWVVKEPYTEEEALTSLRSAYNNPPSSPWIPYGFQTEFRMERETPIVEVIDETIVECEKLNEDLNEGQLNLIYPRDTFRGFIKECADVYSTYLESPYEFWVFNWATIIGSMYAQKVLIPSQLKTQPRLYCVLIGTSGKTRKSESKKQSIEIIRDLLWECEGSQRDEKNKKIYSKYLTYKDGMGSAEGLMRRLKVTPNMILCFDEFRSFVQKSDIKGSNLLQAVTSLFEDTFLENPVKVGSDFDRVDDCALSLLACCTSKTWETLFSASFINIGLPNRLWLVPAEANRKSFTPDSVPEDQLIRLRFRFFKMMEKFPLDVSTPYLIDWEGGGYGDAYQRIEEWYMKMPDNDFTTRIDTYGRKFLMIMAISEGKDVINLDMVERVIPLLDWQMRVREVYQPEEFTNLMSKIESAIRRVIKRNPGITQGRMFNQFRELGGQKDKELALQGLVRSKEIIQKNVIPLTGGKHTVRYFYNPKWKIENE